MLFSTKFGGSVHTVNLVESCSLLDRLEVIEEVGSIVVITELNLAGRVESEAKREYGCRYGCSMLVVFGPVR
jgi:hypothetical protein